MFGRFLLLSTHMPVALVCFVLVIVECAVVMNDPFCNLALHAANTLLSDIVSISWHSPFPHRFLAWDMST